MYEDLLRNYYGMDNGGNAGALGQGIGSLLGTGLGAAFGGGVGAKLGGSLLGGLGGLIGGAFDNQEQARKQGYMQQKMNWWNGVQARDAAPSVGDKLLEARKAMELNNRAMRFY